MILNKAYIWAIFGIALLSFVVGWIFPVEGPLDSAYDDFIKIKKSRYVAAPMKKAKKEIIMLDEDEIEYYYLIPSSMFNQEEN